MTKISIQIYKSYTSIIKWIKFIRHKLHRFFFLRNNIYIVLKLKHEIKQDNFVKKLSRRKRIVGQIKNLDALENTISEVWKRT